MKSTLAVRLGPSPLGLGVIAKRSFRAGETVAKVTGKIVADLDASNDSYLELGQDLTLRPASPFSHLNHSCDPNCELVIDVTQRRAVPTLFLQALRNIEAGEELRNDYAWPADGAIPCRCGSRNCRGWIVAKRDLKRLVSRSLRKGRCDEDVGLLTSFPTEFSQLLNMAGERVLTAEDDELDVSLTRTKSCFVKIDRVIDESYIDTLLGILNTHIFPLLKTLRVPIPKSTITRPTEDYEEVLPKTMNMKTVDLNGVRSRGVITAKKIGLLPMMRSPSFRRFAEVVSGYRLYDDLDCQIHCYENGHYVGPHTDYFPEIPSAKSGYVDLQLTLCNELVDQQWLIYENAGYLSQLENMAVPSAVSVYRLPFWHHTTPLVAKPGREAQARRWVIVGSFDIKG